VQNRAESYSTVEIVASSTLDQRYFECIPKFIQFWLNVPNSKDTIYIPKIYLIAKSLPKSLERYSNYIEIYDPLDLNPRFVSQNIRVLMASRSEADFSITTDIDMYPLSPRGFLFAESLLVKSPDSFVILRDVLQCGQYPICYNMAAPDTWAKMISLSVGTLDVQQALKIIKEKFDADDKYDGLHGGSGWTTDQEFLYLALNNAQFKNGRDIFRLKDSQWKHKRLDRAHSPFPINYLMMLLVPFGIYTDFHIPLPVHENRAYIRGILNIQSIRSKLIRCVS